MESRTIVNRINHLAGLTSDPVSAWQDVVKEYPYFTVGRYLHYASETFASKQPDVVTLSPYKQNPLKFLQFIEDVQKGTHIAPKAFDYQEVNTSVVPDNHTELEEMTTEQPLPQESDPAEVRSTLVQDMPEPEVEKSHEAHDTDLPVATMPTMEDLETEQSNTVDGEYSVETHIQESLEQQNTGHKPILDDKSLMVMMSFTNWLNHFKGKTIREQEEEKEKKALKTAWQKEKLTAVVDEEQEEIPETIFKQAMESISLESSLISESLAGLLAKQGKTDKAIDMYKKLSLRNPEKRAYFADLIKEIHLNNI